MILAPLTQLGIGSFLLLLSAMTVIGTLISDVLLAWVDPRIRLGG